MAGDPPHTQTHHHHQFHASMILGGVHKGLKPPRKKIRLFHLSDCAVAMTESSQHTSSAAIQAHNWGWEWWVEGCHNAQEI